MSETYPPNKYGGYCCKCKDHVAAGEGFYWGSTVVQGRNRWGEVVDRHRHLVICGFCLHTDMHNEEMLHTSKGEVNRNATI